MFRKTSSSGKSPPAWPKIQDKRDMSHCDKASWQSKQAEIETR